MFKDLLKYNMDWILFYCALSSVTLLSIIIAVFYVTHEEYTERIQYERIQLERNLYEIELLED